MKGLMNNEIQLSSLGSSLPAQPRMTRGALGGYMGGGAAAPKEESALHKVHRLLRGRYLMAFGLGVIGAICGAAGGFLSQKPAYKAEALIEVKAIQISPNSKMSESDKIMPMLSA